MAISLRHLKRRWVLGFKISGLGIAHENQNLPRPLAAHYYTITGGGHSVVIDNRKYQ
jgi:hypothetical protein